MRLLCLSQAQEAKFVNLRNILFLFIVTKGGVFGNYFEETKLVKAPQISTWWLQNLVFQ